MSCSSTRHSPGLLASWFPAQTPVICPSCEVPSCQPSFTPVLGKLFFSSQLQHLPLLGVIWEMQARAGALAASLAGPGPAAPLPCHIGKLYFSEQNHATLPKHPTNARCVLVLHYLLLVSGLFTTVY